jgi:transcription elongation factor GreA
MANNHTQSIQLTQEGFDELQNELLELTKEKLPAVIERVAKAREHGDLSENAEYHSARDDQQLLEARIEEIETIIAKSVVVKQTRSHQKVGIGSQVTIAKKGSRANKTITMVGEFEADPLQDKISTASPLGKALVGKKKGDTVVVKAPAGETEYTISAIS